MVDLGVAPGLKDAQHCLQWSVGVLVELVMPLKLFRQEKLDNCINI